MTKKLNIPNTKAISLRLSDKEKARFRKAADLDQIKSLTTWLKHQARKRADELGVNEDGSGTE